MIGMKVDRIKREKWELIKQIAVCFGKLEKGVNVGLEVEHQARFTLFNKHSLKCQELKLNKEYNLIITESVNLGTNKYGNWILKIEELPCKIIEETECFYIIESKFKSRIKKDHILGYIIDN